jgi:hypothetical protein
MVHGGVEGVIPGYKAEVTREHLAGLESRLDYLALGHIHKPFTNRLLDDPMGTRGEAVREWLYNPGSLALWRRDEAPWKHGFYDVTVDPSLAGGRSVKHVAVPDRPCAVMYLDVSEFGSPVDLLSGARRLMERERDRIGSGDRPLAFLVLQGRMRFDRRDLDTGELDGMLREIFDPIARDVADQSIPLGGDVRLDGQADGPIDQVALEREVFRQLWLEDERDLPYADRLAELTQEAKHMALDNLPASQIADHVLATYRAMRAGGNGERA